MSRSPGRKRRVLVAPREIAGVAAGLQCGLEAEGLEVDVLLRWPHPFGYYYRESRSPMMRLLSHVLIEPFDSTASRVRHLASLAARIIVVSLVPFRYGTVLYLGPDTLLRDGRDRRWLTRSGVRTITVFLGSEARPPYLDGAYAHGSTLADLASVRNRTRANRARVRKAEADSTYVVNHPGTGQFHERPFLDWTVLGYPSPIAAVTPRLRSQLPCQRPTVLHAPSDARMKGTDRIRAAIAALADAGAEMDYVEVSGRSHVEVLEALRNADLVVDQLYSDVLLPGLATEAARLGTPVVVFGYATELLTPIGQRASLPMQHYNHPENLVAVLENLVRDNRARNELAEVLKACVEGAWSMGNVARRWSLLVTGQPEAAWFDEPGAQPYAHGCAIAQESLVAFLRLYLAEYGAAGLELDHAPQTKRAIVELASTSDQ